MTEIVKDWKKITKTLDPLAKDGAGHAHKLKSAADVDSQINIIEDQLEAMKVCNLSAHHTIHSPPLSGCSGAV